MESKETCRLCLKESQSTINLFSDLGKRLNIANTISQHFGFDIKEDDYHTNLICTDCWDKLKSFHEFYKDVLRTHETLLLYSDADKKFEPKKEIEVKEEVFVEPELNLEESGHLYEDNFSINNDSTSTSSLTETEKKPNRKHSQKRVQVQRKSKRTRKTKQKPVNDNCTTDLDDRQQKITKLRDENKKIEEFFSMACEMCFEQTDTFRNLQTHYRTVHNLRGGYVVCCNRKIRRRGYMLDHIEKHSKSYDCSICNKTFEDHKTLRMHMFYHMPEENKKFKCDICSRRYETKDRLIKHMQEIHPAEDKKTFQCDQCDKKFIAKHVLQTHKRIIHDSAYSCVCDVCGKIFRTKNQCASHVQAVHSGEERDKYQCTICNSWLQNLRTLKRHIQRAHQEGPFPCDQCGKSIANKDALRNHIRYAHNPNQYNCKLCGKCYKSQLSLKEHMASHTGTALYSCSYCPRTFNSNANKYSHQKKKHPDEWQKDREKKLGPKIN